MRWLICISLLFISVSIRAQETGKDGFTNPLLSSGPDPFSFYKDGYYYYTHTLGDRIGIWKTKDITKLKTAEYKTIYTPPVGTMYSKHLWAPEILFIRDKWYVYFAADDGRNENHRMYVLENDSPDPMSGNWVFKGKIADPADKWAIDGDVFEYKKQLYMIWSGWEGDVDVQQNIYIAKMKNPWTIEGKRVCLSRPQLDWETHGDINDQNNPRHVNVNEGPQFLRHGAQLFIVFSASGCWTDFYALGILKFTGEDNLLEAAAWQKHPLPVLKTTVENGVYAPGHNSFFKSPDGTEDWILYHANDQPGQGCGGHRSPRAQKFTWDKQGMPYFGEPVKTGIPLPFPSGSDKDKK